MADDGRGEGPKKKPSREEVLAALAAATDPNQDPDAMSSRIVIKKGGEVIIENLSMDLMELALLLDPDSDIGCDLAPEGGEDEDGEGSC